ncbi:MAG TPA: hypothetical protein DEQ47_08235 [Solibacterales bacterium]|nr:hypothetical protein [Bryobacterales bacterium]
MVSNGVSSPGREEKLQAIDRLAGSSLLLHSESLCNLLRFLASKNLELPGHSAKEYEIATEVFHRPANFDPRLDSTVRVQTGRLRSKLNEYYAQHSDEPVIVEIPKGCYALHFHFREKDRTEAPLHRDEFEHAPHPTAIQVLPGRQSRPARRVVSALAVAALIGCVAVVGFGVYHRSPAPPPAAVLGFWHYFFDAGEEPLVIYSNAEFVGRPETGLRYFQAGTDTNSQILDHYTGVGEVMAIHELDGIADLFRRALRIKRGRLISWDDARNENIIFVGSPSENLSLREVPATHDFIFRLLNTATGPGDLAIVNLHPKPGEKAAYFGSAGHPVTEDYALVEMVPGLTAQHHILILAGTTTFGTQAAVEYVCRPKRLEELLLALTGSTEGKLSAPFGAVIRVQVSGGVPIQTELVALRKH